MAASLPLREFTFAELEAATGGFSDCVGEGEFAKVYRGRMVLPVGGSSASDGGNSADVAGYYAGDSETVYHEVAVKVMKGSRTPGEIERFRAEVQASSAMNHPNVLRLEGVALNAEKRLLFVYELINLGDLEAYLMRVRRNEDWLPWKYRVKVALGCAEALAEIHEKGFIHGDFKPSRVLLRQDLTPVVAGVDVEEWDIRMPSAVIGTPGYTDPTYFHTGQGRQTTDIYSFGVFLLELIFGYDPIDKRFEELKEVVSHGDWNKVVNDPSLVTDPAIEGEWNKVHVLTMIILARFATDPDLVRRPKMGDIAAKLQGIWSVISG
ncbi:unnamed protein product [Closterium sp. NIES-65]|nr:unnamed protein product [Closterium sp. NIES-65]